LNRFTRVACANALLIFTAMFAQAGTALAAPPANDNRASAEALDTLTPSVKGTNLEATTEAGEPDHAGASGLTNPSVWFKWTAPANGRWNVNVCASDYDTTLAVYGAGSGTPIASNNDGCASDNGSFVVFQATAGTTYEIAVSGAAGATGTITGFMIQAPANDQFGTAKVLSGTDPARLTGTTEGATGEPSEPNHAATSVATACSSATAPSPFCMASIWFTWTPPSTGRYEFSACGSEFDTTLGVYTGSAVAALTATGANDDGCPGNQSLLFLNVTAGTTYRIALAGFAGRGGIGPDVGPYSLDISPAPTDNAFTGVKPNSTKSKAPKFAKSIVVKGGKAKFRLMSAEAASGTLSATTVKKFRVKAKKPKKRVFFGKVKFSLKAGIAKTVTLKLSKAGRALLKKKRAVKVLITINAKDEAGNLETTTRRVTLKLPVKRK
jgi:hypothetical protein